MSPSDEQIARRLHDVLERNEFKPGPQETYLKYIFDALKKAFDVFAGLSTGGAVMATCLLGALAVCAVYLFWTLIARPYSQHIRASMVERGTAEVPVMSPAGLLEQARRLANAGELRAAARHLQQALLLQQCNQRGMMWRPTLADEEWMALLQPPVAVVALAREAQHLAFGPGPTAQRFDACLTSLHALIGSASEGGSDA